MTSKIPENLSCMGRLSPREIKKKAVVIIRIIKIVELLLPIQ